MGFVELRGMSRREKESAMSHYFGAKNAQHKAMVTMFLSLIGVSVVGSLVFVLKQIANAPEGYENETGFHYVAPQAELISRRESSEDTEWQRIVRPSKAAFKSVPVSSASR